MAAFERRLDHVVAQAVSSRHDASGWDTVTTREELAAQRYQTWIFRAAGDRRSPPTTRRTVRKVVGHVVTSGRETLVLSGSETFKQRGGGDAKKQTRRYDALWVMERTSPHGRWRMSDDFSLDDVALPKPAGGPASPTGKRSPAGTRPDLNRITAAVIDGLELGDRSIAGSKLLAKVRDRIQVSDDIDPNFSCYPRSTKPKTRVADPAGPDVLVLPRASLTVLRLRCDVHHWGRAGARIKVPAPQAKVDHVGRVVDDAVESYAMPVLVSARPGHAARVLVVEPQRVLRSGAPRPSLTGPTS